MATVTLWARRSTAQRLGSDHIAEGADVVMFGHFACVFFQADLRSDARYVPAMASCVKSIVDLADPS